MVALGTAFTVGCAALVSEASLSATVDDTVLPTVTATAGSSTGSTRTGAAEETNEHSTSDFGALLAYVPQDFWGLNLRPFDQTIYLLDLVKIRAANDIDLMDSSATSDEKRPLIILFGTQTQSIESLPPDAREKLATAADIWGWDIADLDQSLYIPYLRAGVYRGRFDAERIQARLAAAGFAEYDVDSFVTYQSDESKVAFALNEDMLLAAQDTLDGLQAIDTLELLIEQATISETGMGKHEATVEILPELADTWGAALIPQPNNDEIETMIRTLASADRLPASIQQRFQEMVAQGVDQRLGWDVAALAHHGIEPTEISLVFHCTSKPPPIDEAQEMAEALMQMDSFTSRNLTWEKVLTLEEVAVRANNVVLTASTKSRNLIGTTVASRDYSLLLFYIQPE